MDAILRLLRDEYGIDFSHYKASTVTRRIERRLALNRSLDIDMYVEQLRSDPRELSSLYQDLLIGVTRFFRDDGRSRRSSTASSPSWSSAPIADEQIRVWVPGCATGEEAYSIAMLFHERLDRAAPARQAQDPRDRRPQGVARSRERRHLRRRAARRHQRAERLERFFTPSRDGYQISQALREIIVFAPHNLIRTRRSRRWT